MSASRRQMPFITLDRASPLAPERATPTIFYREYGTGDPLIILHGGWGYSVYPFERQVAAFASRYRIVIPDRTGYGQSGRLAALPPDFHDRAAVETFALIERLRMVRPVLWGHSDGAVIAAKMAIQNPGAVRAIVLEAVHYRRDKPASRPFFEAMARNPAMLGERVCRVLAEEHGDDYWRTLLDLNGRAWLAIGGPAFPTRDLYDGRLREVSVPTAVIHGRRDPRTEPGELDQIADALPHAMLAVHEIAGHSPHSSFGSADWTTERVATFLEARR